VNQEYKISMSTRVFKFKFKSKSNLEDSLSGQVASKLSAGPPLC